MTARREPVRSRAAQPRRRTGRRPRERDGPMHLLPGMTVTAEIKVGTRTIISYFLYPLLRGLDDSIREP